MAKVAVIILNWNGLNYTRECIKHLERSSFSDIDIIVLDNGSTNNEADRLNQEFGDGASIHRSDTNLGFAGGNNYVVNSILQNNQYDYYLLLNQDTEIDKFCIERLVHYMDSHPAVAVTGPRVLETDNKTIQSQGADIDLRTGKIISRQQLREASTVTTETESVDCIVGNCFMTRAAVVKKIGLFDEMYFAYYEEADWCVRARAEKYSCVVVPSATITHARASGFRTYLNVRNMIWFEKKFASPGQLVYFWIFFWILYIPERLKKGSPVGELLRAAWHGWLGLKKGKFN